MEIIEELLGAIWLPKEWKSLDLPEDWYRSSTLYRVKSFFEFFKYASGCISVVPEPKSVADLIEFDTNEDAIYKEKIEEREELVKFTKKLQRRKYEKVLKAEALRLGCSIKNLMIKAECLTERPEDMVNCVSLTTLDENIVCSIFEKMELVDLLKMSCVGKIWKKRIEDFVAKKTRVEYHITSHLLRDQRWMEDIKSCDIRKVFLYWIGTASKVTHWAVNICTNLEILCIHWCIKVPQLNDILGACPHLKHVCCSYIDLTDLDDYELFIPKLKSLVLTHFAESCMSNAMLLDSRNENDLEVLDVNCRGTVDHIVRETSEYIYKRAIPPQAQSYNDSFPPTDIHFKCLTTCSFRRLKYFRLCFFPLNFEEYDQWLPEVLSSCPDLLVFILGEEASYRISRLMTIAQLFPKLKVLWITDCYETVKFTLEELRDAYHVFHNADPKRSFTDFNIIVSAADAQRFSAEIPFNFIETDDRTPVIDKYSPCHPYMKAIINTPF